MIKHKKALKGAWICRSAVICGFTFALLFAGNVNAKTMYAKDAVNIRKEPDKTAEVIKLIYLGDKVNVKNETEEWAEVKLGKKKTGYIFKELLTEEQPESKPENDSDEVVKKDTPIGGSTYVNGSCINIRAKASRKSDKLGVFEQNEYVVVQKYEGDWAKVLRKDETSGWIMKKYLGERHMTKQEYLDTFREDAQYYAEGRIGDIYSQDYRNCDGYADCSSLVRDAFASAAGIDIGDTTYEQTEKMQHYMYAISCPEDANVGDLIYADANGEHVGIYIGGGQVLHASQCRGEVCITDYSGSGYWHYGCNAALYCYEH